jgi:twitching motility protein PilT
MQTFDQSIFDLYQRGLITYEEAQKMTSRPDDFALKVKGISSTSDAGWDKDGQPPSPGSGDDFKIQRF